MVSVQDTLGASGACPSIDDGQRVWKIGFPTGRAIANLEESIAATAIKEVMSLKTVLPESEYQEMWASLESGIISREHRVGGKIYNRVMASNTGGILFLLALLRENHPTAMEADAIKLLQSNPEECRLAIVRVSPDFIRLVANRMGVTNESKIEEVVRRVVEARTDSTLSD